LPVDSPGYAWLKLFAENEPSIVVHRSLSTERFVYSRIAAKMRNLCGDDEDGRTLAQAMTWSGMSPYCQIQNRTLKKNTKERKHKK